MRETLKDIIEEHEVPKEVKERLMKSAKIQLLFRDVGELFISFIPRCSADLVEITLTDPKKNKQ